MFSELASLGRYIVSSYGGMCFLKQEPSLTNGGGGGGDGVYRKEDANGEKSSHGKAELARFFETCFKQVK